MTYTRRLTGLAPGLIALPIAISSLLGPEVAPAAAGPAATMPPLLSRPVSPWWLMVPATGLMVRGIRSQPSLARRAFSASTRSSKGTLVVPRI